MIDSPLWKIVDHAAGVPTRLWPHYILPDGRAIIDLDGTFFSHHTAGYVMRAYTIKWAAQNAARLSAMADWVTDKAASGADWRDELELELERNVLRHRANVRTQDHALAVADLRRYALRKSEEADELWSAVKSAWWCEQRELRLIPVEKGGL